LAAIFFVSHHLHSFKTRRKEKIYYNGAVLAHKDYTSRTGQAIYRYLQIHRPLLHWPLNPAHLATQIDPKVAQVGLNVHQRLIIVDHQEASERNRHAAQQRSLNEARAGKLVVLEPPNFSIQGSTYKENDDQDFKITFTLPPHKNIKIRMEVVNVLTITVFQNPAVPPPRLIDSRGLPNEYKFQVGVPLEFQMLPIDKIVAGACRDEGWVTLGPFKRVPLVSEDQTLNFN
jgi:hypothetical protein